MNISIGENIKHLRREKNVTQEQLAQALNVSTTAVSKWERNDTYPDITMLFPIAYYFQITIDELMGYNAEKIASEISEALDKYHALCYTNPKEARECIVEAYRKYPNDYFIMHQYMWEMGGTYADNDTSVLLEHSDEFLKICDQLDGCPEFKLRLDASNMRAKLLHAKGMTGESLTLYRSSFPDWYSTYEQKSEQLFAKNTPEFEKWLVDNMLELAEFTVNKKVKDIWYCHDYTLKEKAEKGMEFAQALTEMREKYGYNRLCCIERSVLSDHVWKMAAFGVAPEDIAPALERLFEISALCDEMAKHDQALHDKFNNSKYNGNLVKFKIKEYESSGFKVQSALLENPACRAVFDKWRNIDK